jgi:hypothetical protein
MLEVSCGLKDLCSLLTKEREYEELLIEFVLDHEQLARVIVRY